MSRRRNQAQALDVPSPDALEPYQALCHVGQSRGSSQFEVVDGEGRVILVELPAKFRKNVWVRRGSYVIVDTSQESSSSRIGGTIEYVLQAEHVKEWKRLGKWPSGFEEAPGSQTASNADEPGDETAAEATLQEGVENDAEGADKAEHMPSEQGPTSDAEDDLWQNPNRR